MSFTEDSYFGHRDPTFPFIYSLTHFPKKDLFLSVLRVQLGTGTGFLTLRTCSQQTACPGIRLSPSWRKVLSLMTSGCRGKPRGD